MKILFTEIFFISFFCWRFVFVCNTQGNKKCRWKEGQKRTEFFPFLFCTTVLMRFSHFLLLFGKLHSSFRLFFFCLLSFHHNHIRAFIFIAGRYFISSSQLLLYSRLSVGVIIVWYLNFIYTNIYFFAFFRSFIILTLFSVFEAQREKRIIIKKQQKTSKDYQIPIKWHWWWALAINLLACQKYHPAEKSRVKKNKIKN